MGGGQGIIQADGLLGTRQKAERRILCGLALQPSVGWGRYSRAWVGGGRIEQPRRFSLPKISADHAARYALLTIAQALGVSLDHLVGNSEVLLDKDLIKRITEIQQLSEADRQGVFFALDGLLRDAKERKAYA